MKWSKFQRNLHNGFKRASIASARLLLFEPILSSLGDKPLSMFALADQESEPLLRKVAHSST